MPLVAFHPAYHPCCLIVLILFYPLLAYTSEIAPISDHYLLLITSQVLQHLVGFGCVPTTTDRTWMSYLVGTSFGIGLAILIRMEWTVATIYLLCVEVGITGWGGIRLGSSFRIQNREEVEMSSTAV